MNLKNTIANEQINTVPARVLRLIWESGGVSRTDIASGLSIAKATVTKIVNRLIADEILMETGEEADSHIMKQGRRKVMVDFCTEKRFILGVYISTDRLSAGLTTLRGECMGKINKPLYGNATLQSINAEIRSAMETLVKDSCITPDRILTAGIAASPELLQSLGTYDYSIFEENIRAFAGCFVHSGNSTALCALACSENDGGVNQPYSRIVLDAQKGKVYMTEIGENALFERELYRLRDITRAADLMETSAEPFNRSVTALAKLIANILVISGGSCVGLVGAFLRDDELNRIEAGVQELTGEDMSGRIKVYGLPEKHLYRAGSFYGAMMSFCRSGELFSGEVN